MTKETLKTLAVAIIAIILLTMVASYISNLIKSSQAYGPWPIESVPVSPGFIPDISLPLGKLRVVTNNESGQWTPDIYEDIVVWKDKRHNDYGNIYMRDVSQPQSTERRLTYNSSQSDPVIYGDIVVWADWRTGQYTPSIYMLDITDPPGTPPTNISSNSLYNSNPAIHGDIIVWTAGTFQTYEADIYMHNLKDPIGVNTNLTSTPNRRERFADVWEDTIVFQVELNQDTNLSNVAYIRVGENPGGGFVNQSSSSQGNPSIDDNRVVWVEEDGNIYMSDLSIPGTAIVPITSTGSSSDPHIHNNIVVWKAYNSGYSIFMHDLNDAVGINTDVSRNDSYQIEPSIYNKKIVWTDWRNALPPPPEISNTDIYMLELL